MIRKILALVYGLLGLVLLAVAWLPALDSARKPANPALETPVPVKRYVVGTVSSLIVMAGAAYFLRRARKTDLEAPPPRPDPEPDEDEDPYQYK